MLLPTVYLYSDDEYSPRVLDCNQTQLCKFKIGASGPDGIRTPSKHNAFFNSKVLSKNHAELWVRAGTVLIRDLGSKNGTYLKGEQLSLPEIASEWHAISTGDELVLLLIHGSVDH